jgi:AcrR family transcriptional regulator
MTMRGRPRGFDRDSALRKAMTIFWEKGFESTSMTDLIEAMGINSPSLYAAFGSKESLFAEAVALYSAEVGWEIWDALEREPTIVGAIHAFLHETARAYSARNRPQGCMIVLGAHHGVQGESAVTDDLRMRREENIRHLRARFDRAVTQGELPSHFDVNRSAVFYAALQHGMSILARDGADKTTLDAVARHGADSLTALLAPA